MLPNPGAGYLSGPSSAQPMHTHTRNNPQILFSNRLLSASSISHGKFVAASTITVPPSLPIPSICVRISLFTRREASWSVPLREEQRESISSMKIVEGA